MAKAIVRVEMPWMGGTREERRARLLAFYEGRGERMAVAMASRLADDPMANLCGDCGPVLDELNAGLVVEEVAEKWGVPAQTIYSHLLKYAPEEFRAASANRALSRRKVCTEELEAASDNVSVSKWRALLQSSEWDLEKLLPRIYGQKQGAEGLTITVNLDRSCGGAVEIEARDGGGVSQTLKLKGAEASVVGNAG